MVSIGVDIGGTNIRVALVDRGLVIRKVEERIQREDFNSFKNQLLRLINIVRTDEVKAIGISIAGLFKGNEVFSPNLPFKRFNIIGILKSLDLPIEVINDGVAGAIGEKLHGNGTNNFVYLTIGTGIGGGIVVDGKVLKGRYGNAHEIGHIVLDPKGRLRCGCGGLGHWEAYCSGAGIVNFYNYLSKGRRAESTEEVFSRREVGDRIAERLFEECYRLNAAGIASVIYVYDPDTIVIGGGLALNRWEEYIKPSIDLINTYVNVDLPSIKPSKLRENAPLIGAAHYAERRGRI